MKKFKKIICLLLVLFTLLTSNFGCIKSSWFSEEKHLAKVEKIINEKISNCKNGKIESTKGKFDFSKYETFRLYPVYNENEEFKYILVEFEPFGFAFICIREERTILLKDSLYIIDGKDEWYPYSKCKETGEEIYEYNENGEQLVYEKSPFYITNNLNAKKYLIRNPNDGYSYMCAVKEGEKFVNLVSGERFNLENKDILKQEAVIFLYFIPKVYFYL